MSDVQRAGDALYQKLWSTRGSRFIARARLRAMNVLSVAAVAILSVYVIGLSITGIVFQREITDLGQSLINAINVCLSVGILAFSLIETSRKHLVESEAMNLSALDIGKIYDRFLIEYHSKTLTTDSLRQYSEAYSNVLDRYGTNHGDIDWLKFQNAHPRDFELHGFRGWFKRRWIEVRYWIAICWLYVIAIVIPPIGVGALFWKWSAVLITGQSHG